MSLPPFGPIHRLFVRRLQSERGGRDTVREQDCVCARPSRTWYDQPIEAEEKRGIRDVLRLSVLTFLIAGRFHSKLLQRGQIGEVQHRFRDYCKFVGVEQNLRGKYRLQCQERVDFRNRAIAVEARVENIEFTIAPAAERPSSLQRVSPFP
jgi:hypothetical protein